MNPTLSGTGWGELVEPKEELNIPYWMTKEFREAERRINDEYAANIAAAVSRERRKIRAVHQQEATKKKTFKVGFYAVPALSAVLMVAGHIVEVLL